MSFCPAGGRWKPVCDDVAINFCSDRCPVWNYDVCGTDGKTYNNKCELAWEWCRTGGRVDLAYCGSCSKFLVVFVLVILLHSKYTNTNYYKDLPVYLLTLSCMICSKNTDDSLDKCRQV